MTTKVLFSFISQNFKKFVTSARLHQLLQSDNRGALIIVEGGDRSGKTTLAKRIVSHLKDQNVPAQYLNFPDRSTRIGSIIDEYLRSKGEQNDETIHLLFSANRWEKLNEINELLLSGTTLVIDRYVFSGVAYSTAKGLSFDWCKSSDIGLPKPDKVYFLEIDEKTQASRNGFGSERYEVSEFQKKVTEVYKSLEDSYWEYLNASKSTDDLMSQITSSLTKLLEDVKVEPIHLLWKSPT